MTEKGEVIGQLICTRCGESIINEKVKINGYPSIEMVAEFSNHLGKKIRVHIHLSSIWGDYEKKVENDLQIPRGTVLKLSCPKCGKEFLISGKCTRIGCRGQLITLLTDEEIINACNIYDCHEHGFTKKNSHQRTIREVDKNHVPFKGRITGIFC